MPRIRKVEETRSKDNRIIWRIAVYIRLSRDDGNDESLSVTNQKKIIREYLEKFFEEEYVIVDFYIDDGISGTTDDSRTDFLRMIDDVKTALSVRHWQGHSETMPTRAIIWKNFSRCIRQDLSVWEALPLILIRIQNPSQTAWTFLSRDL